jgi:hypothetical protein
MKNFSELLACANPGSNRGLHSQAVTLYHVFPSAFIKKVATRSGEIECACAHGALPLSYSGYICRRRDSNPQPPRYKRCNFTGIRRKLFSTPDDNYVKENCSTN